MCGLTDNSKCETFENGNVVRFKVGPQTAFLWGDTVIVEYFLISSDQTDVSDGYIRVYCHPYTMEFPVTDFELVTDDEFEDFPDSFVEGWAWWDSLEDTDDYTGPNFIEYLGR